MPWHEPRTWATGEVVSESRLNEQLRNNMSYLKALGDQWAGYIHIRDEKAQNIAGGTFTAGAWRTRDLTIIVSDPSSLVSLGSHQITINAAGTFRYWISVPCFYGDSHQGRLYNVSDTAVEKLGTVGRINTANPDQTRSFIYGAMVLAGSKVFEVQHWCTRTQATNGFGFAGNIDTEVYTEVEIWKVAD